MNKTLLMSLLVLTTSYWTVPSQAAEHQLPTISVQGSGVVATVPDYAILQMSVGSRHASVSAAKTSVDHKIEQISAMLKTLGVNAVDINNAPLEIYPEYQQDQTKTELFRVERQVTVLIKDLNTYPQILEQATQLGITQLQPVRLLSANTAELYQQALTLAFADAEQKAQHLAKLSGRKIARVQQIQEQGSAPAPRHKMALMAAESVHFGNNEVRADIFVQFELVKP